MKQKYLITDPRPLESFKDKTFSDFKKLDVFKALYKSIETGKVENSCHWITECIISGYGIEVMEKLIIFGSKIIHINSPLLPQYYGIDMIHLEIHIIISIRNKKKT